jgi:hypothetical protein
LLAMAIGVVLVRRRTLGLEARRAAIAIVANVAIQTALVCLLAGWAGPLMASRSEATGALVRYGILAVVVLSATSAWCLRALRGDERLAAAITTSCIALAVALLPAAYIWIEFPAPNASLPGPAWLATIPALQVTAACAAMHAALSLGLELLWFVRSRF